MQIVRLCNHSRDYISRVLAVEDRVDAAPREELNFPQPKAAPPIPLDELHALIQRRVQRLGWTVEQVKAFVASHFGDRGRSQLQDDELPTLLYYLEVEVMKTLGAGLVQGDGL